MGEITSEPNFDPNQMKSEYKSDFDVIENSPKKHAEISYDVKIALIVIFIVIFFIGIILNIPGIEKIKKV